MLCSSTTLTAASASGHWNAATEHATDYSHCSHYYRARLTSLLCALLALAPALRVCSTIGAHAMSATCSIESPAISYAVGSSHFAQRSLADQRTAAGKTKTVHARIIYQGPEGVVLPCPAISYLEWLPPILLPCRRVRITLQLPSSVFSVALFGCCTFLLVRPCLACERLSLRSP